MSATTSLVRLRAILGAAFAVALWASALSAESVPPMQRRLQISIDYLRQAGTRQGADTANGRLVQQLVLNAVLQSDGTPMINNPLDPDDGRRQLERARRTQQKVQAALDRQGRGAAATPAAAAMDAQALQARARQLQARCGSDRDCLMREAMTLSAAQTARGDAGMQARLQGYGAAGPTDPDEAVETPYLHFSGRSTCGLDVSTKVDERIEGSFQDVQGTVPFTQTTQAGRRLLDDASCPVVQVVLDTRNGRLWTNIQMALREAPGVTVRSEKGRSPQRTEGPVTLQWHEAGDWIGQRLLNLSAAGDDQARIAAGAGARKDGQVEVKLRWRFEPV